MNRGAHKQAPAAVAHVAQRMCEYRLICENDQRFMNSPMLEGDVSEALAGSNRRGALRSARRRIVAGFWLERYGTLPAGYENDLPWFDSLYDPADPTQVIPARTEQTDDPMCGWATIAATVVACADSRSTAKPNTSKESTVSNPSPIKIETRVFIDGVQASGFTVDQLHQKVREQEAVIKDLEKIENKSKKLGAEITKRYESIKALNEYIDGLPD